VTISDIRSSQEQGACSGMGGTAVHEPQGAAVYVTEAAFVFLGARSSPIENLLKPTVRVPLSEKKHFAASMYTHCARRDPHTPALVMREVFYQLLTQEYKQPHAMSGCMEEMNTHEMNIERQVIRVETQPTPEQSANFNDPFLEAPIRMYRPFKFVFAFDNSDCDGALSEKVVNAALADAVPIYWGARDVAQLLNREAIVHCDVTFNTAGDQALVAEHTERHGMAPSAVPDEAFDLLLTKRYAATLAHLRAQPAARRCIDEIKRLDGDDRAFEAKVAQPLYSAGARSGFDLARLAADLRRVMAAQELAALQAAGRPCEAAAASEYQSQ
jgi:hypothetical protein